MPALCLGGAQCAYSVHILLTISEELLLLDAMSSAPVHYWQRKGFAVCCVCRFASNLTVHVLEAIGMLQAYTQPQCAATSASSSRAGLTPAAAVYVKVYARDAGGDEFFYK